MKLGKTEEAADEGTESAAPRTRIRQLLTLVEGQGRTLIFIAVLSVLGAAASLAQPVLVARVIDDVGSGAGLGAIVWLLVGLVVAAGVLSAWQQYLLQQTGEGIVLNARRGLIARMFRLPIAEYDHRDAGDLVARLGTDTSLLRVALTQGMVAAMGGTLTFVGALVAMALLDWVLLAVTLAVVALSFIVVTALGASIQKASARVQDLVGRLVGSALTTVQAVRTVRAANATERRESDALGIAVEAQSAGLKLAAIAAVISPVSGLATQVSFLAVIGIGGLRVATGELTIADLVAFILFLFMLIMPLSQAFEAVTAVNQALGAYARISEIVDGPQEPQTTTTAAAVPLGAAPSLAFDRVGMTYSSGDGRETLSDITFEVPSGARVALVGPSGAGKSTVLQIIEGFYPISHGHVRVGGVDIKDIGLDRLRSMIGYVEQDAPALAGTLRSNLQLAAPHVTEERCREVLGNVNLLHLVDGHPEGIDALVGQNGVTLSGGERQRLAIARALIADPRILLLDESTSSLDSVNEQLMRAALETVSAQRTVLVVAHRLSTIIDADLIIVMDEGTIVDRGTHADLLKSSRLYRELAEHQLLA